MISYCVIHSFWKGRIMSTLEVLFIGLFHSVLKMAKRDSNYEKCLIE